MHISGFPLTVSLSSDLNGEIIPPLRRRFSSIQPRASLSLLVKGLNSPKKQHLCTGCFLLLEWCQNVFCFFLQPKVTVTAAVSRSYKKNCNVWLPCIDKWPLSFNSRTFKTCLTFKSEEGGKGGWKSSRQGSISPEKRGILPSCFL